MPENSILIVDDDMSVSTGVRMTLEGRYDVATVESASDAFEHLSSNKVDLVLMDIKMPRMNGLEALKKIRERHPDLLVVMLTAYPTEQNMREAWESGADGFISKPFELSGLRTYIDTTLSRKK